MSYRKKIFSRWQGLILLAIVTAFLEPAYCQTDTTALLIQQTPAQGGTVTPDLGLQQFELYTDVTLTAVPKPGYQFVYWLGDVSDPTASTTIAYLDAPKIIVAVFERIEYEFLIPAELTKTAGSGGGGLRRHTGDYARGGGGGAVKRKTQRPWAPPQPPEPPEPEPTDIPIVPGENESDLPVSDIPESDFPVPVPEPATVILLGLGTLFASTRARKKH